VPSIFAANTSTGAKGIVIIITPVNIASAAASDLLENCFCFYCWWSFIAN
jgi:hypothetical protein